MSATIQDVRNLFERYGWQFKERDEETLLTGFMGKTRPFTIGARLQENWLALSVAKYLPAIPKERQNDVNRELLKINTQVSLVRFALISDEELILITDVPAHKKLDYDFFALSLEYLCLYAVEYYPQLYKLVTGNELPVAEGKEAGK